jgi:hypothetical protein
MPHGELERALATTLAVRPELLAVNFTGLHYVGDGAWINRFMFPMNAADFLAEVTALTPEQRTVDLRPGDEVHLGSREPPSVLPQASSWVGCSESGDSAAKLRFDPAYELPRLRDPDPEGLGRTLLAPRIAAFLQDELCGWIRDEVTHPGSLCARYARVGIRMRLHVTYSDDSEESWLIDPGADAVVLHHGGGSAAQIGLRIAASVLDRWRRAEIPYFRVYPFARPYGSAYCSGLRRDGEIEVRQIETRDLIATYFSSDFARVYHPWLRRVLQQSPGQVQ